MSLSSAGNNNNGKAVILHFVTWYPTAENHVDGIFTCRHIDVLAADDTTTHIVVKKTEEEVSILTYLKCLLGFFPVTIYQGRSVILFPVNSFLFRRFFWRFKPKLQALILRRFKTKLQPSLLHLHVVYGFAEEALYLHRQYRIPMLISEHMAPFPFDWLWNKDVLVVQPMQAAAAVVAVSEAQAEQIEKYTGVVPEVISNVVATEEFFYLPEEKTSGTDIVLVGIYESRKGADYLVSVFSSFIQKCPDARLHLVGEAKPKRMGMLTKQIVAAGIQAHVFFHGKLQPKELCLLYRKCDFYVCASEWESFGVSVLEALFTGLPVLSTDCGGVHSFICAGNGVLIDNDRKPETLLKGMVTMTEKLTAFKREQIAAEVAERFSPHRIKEAYYSIYNRVLTAK